MAKRKYPIKFSYKTYGDLEYAWFDSQNRWHNPLGPAVRWENGSVEWFIHGIRFRDQYKYQNAANLSNRDMMLIKLKYGPIK
jgi:hypothetical protein